jgi:hypothetical protein
LCSTIDFKLFVRRGWNSNFECCGSMHRFFLFSRSAPPAKLLLLLLLLLVFFSFVNEAVERKKFMFFKWTYYAWSIWNMLQMRVDLKSIKLLTLTIELRQTKLHCRFWRIQKSTEISTWGVIYWFMWDFFLFLRQIFVYLENWKHSFEYEKCVVNWD